MKCQNCGEREANIRYTQIMNGKKEELNLCSECAQKLGLDEMGFSLPIDFSSFFGEFLENDNSDLLSNYLPKQVQCEQCGMTLEEFIDKGKFGCANCYQVFSKQINQLLKNIHGTDTHVGRKKIQYKEKDNIEKNVVVENKKQKDSKYKIEQLKEELKQAIQVENYERAAEIRDKIKELEGKEG